MKMTKIAFWRKVKEVCSKSKKGDGGRCYAYVSGACTCEDSSPVKENGRCEMAQDVSISKGRKEDVIAYAEKQIKRHESKTKKKDHILDTTKKVEEPKPIKTVGIDNSDVTLAQYEHVKDCPVNSEYPQPIKLPAFVYSAHKFGIDFAKTENMILTTNEKCELFLNGNPCFATLEEALQVAKKLWNGEGK